MVETTQTASKREPVISSQVMAVVIFIFTEIMIFASFISSFTIIKSSYSNWPPMGQPRLPIEVTAVNSLFLLLSAVFLFIAFRRFKTKAHQAKAPLFIALLLALLFVFIQGYEWVRLIGYGLTLTSSLYGSFFYLIIGFHAIHVLVACLALLFVYFRLNKGILNQATFGAMRVFWFFVVGVWPILYYLVYL